MIAETQRYNLGIRTDVWHVEYDHRGLGINPVQGPGKHRVGFVSSLWTSILVGRSPIIVLLYKV